MTKTILAGNWKMALSRDEAKDLARELAKVDYDSSKLNVLVTPSHYSLGEVQDILKESSLAVGAQDSHWENKGAYTGQVSPTVLKNDFSLEFSLVGHSERRQMMGDTDELIARKTMNIVKSGLKAIVCIGETEKEKSEGKTFDVLERQLKSALSQLIEGNLLEKCIVAYEPVWAIGTGNAASVEDVEKTHKFINTLLKTLAPKEDIAILYGGSTSPDNIKELVAIPEVSGALVGGASLNVEKFSKMIEICENC